MLQTVQVSQGRCLFWGRLRWVPDPALLLCPREPYDSLGSDLAWGIPDSSAQNRCHHSWSGCPRKPWSVLRTFLGWEDPWPYSACTCPASLSNPSVPCGQPLPGETQVPVPRASTCLWCSVSASAWPACPRKSWDVLGPASGWGALLIHSTCTQPRFPAQPWCGQGIPGSRGCQHPELVLIPSNLSALVPGLGVP